MSAITLAQKKIQMGDPKVFLETLDGIGLLKESVEEILAREELVDFFKTQKTTRKKVSITDEERLGQYDGGLCDARLWKEKPKSGGLGYDNIQCSSKKVDGCDCLCKKHFKLQGEGKFWTGLITEPRSEEPTKPDGTLMFWSTDKDGNDVVKEKKARKSSEPKKKKEPKKKEPKKKEPKDYSRDELMALLAKAEKKEEKKKEEKKKEEKEEKKGSLEDAKEAMRKMSDEMKEDEEEKEEKEEKEDEDEDDVYEEITVDGTEYQRNKEDNTVIRVDDFSPVGVWNTDTEKIDFDEEE